MNLIVFFLSVVSMQFLWVFVFHLFQVPIWKWFLNFTKNLHNKYNTKKPHILLPPSSPFVNFPLICIISTCVYLLVLDYFFQKLWTIWNAVLFFRIFSISYGSEALLSFCHRVISVYVHFWWFVQDTIYILLNYVYGIKINFGFSWVSQRL